MARVDDYGELSLFLARSIIFFQSFKIALRMSMCLRTWQSIWIFTVIDVRMRKLFICIMRLVALFHLQPVDLRGQITIMRLRKKSVGLSGIIAWTWYLGII